MSQQSTYNFRTYVVVCNIMLIGAYLLLGTLSILFLIGLHLGDRTTIGRLVICSVAFLYIACVQLITRGKQLRTAYLLLAFYLFFATCALWIRGATSPVAIFTLGLVVGLTGIVLKAKCAFRAALVASVLVIGAQAAAVLNVHIPFSAWTNKVPGVGNVFEYCGIFGLLALLAWFYNREVEHSSIHAEEAEASLVEQRATLKKQVLKRTSKLEETQLKEIQQMYHFAELGQLGVTLLHDLANHLTALTLEIEGMQNKRQTKAASRARQIIHYLEVTVDSTRDRLHGSIQPQPFNVVGKTSEAIAFLDYKASRANTTIEWRPPAYPWMYEGDSAGYSQVVAIVVSNAIDACGMSTNEVTMRNHRVLVTLERDKAHIILRVHNWGKGIPKRQLKNLFRPFHTTKKTGMGIGLFMARQTMETSFHGTLTLNTHSDHTEFSVTLPVSLTSNKKTQQGVLLH